MQSVQRGYRNHTSASVVFTPKWSWRNVLTLAKETPALLASLRLFGSLYINSGPPCVLDLYWGKVTCPAMPAGSLRRRSAPPPTSGSRWEACGPCCRRTSGWPSARRWPSAGRWWPLASWLRGFSSCPSPPRSSETTVNSIYKGDERKHNG